MKIIQKGDLNRPKGIKRFKCSVCGCVFEADNTEYKTQYSQRENCGWYEIKCPTCYRFVTLSDTEEKNGITNFRIG